jgi:hypothetical protein
MPPMIAPPAAPPPIFAASCFFVASAMRDTVSVLMDNRSASPGGSILVNRNATRARPLTRADRSAAVTTPDTAVPTGKA